MPKQRKMNRKKAWNLISELNFSSYDKLLTSTKLLSVSLSVNFEIYDNAFMAFCLVINLLQTKYYLILSKEINAIVF